MTKPLDEFVRDVSDSGLLPDSELRAWLETFPADSRPQDGEQLAREMVKHKKLTKFQAEQLYAGKGKSLTLGNYVILDKLGQGGMGMVLKAEHKRMKRLVAIKVMSPAAVKTPDSLKRFHREVEAAAKLRHPNIVAADDADEAKGTHFLVMEYVEGSDLSVLIKKHGPLPVEQAVRCIIQAARGLEFAHEQGVIHRDIKPANLLIDAKGTVKILDMGLARIEGAVGGSSEGAGLTSTGTIMGTVDYMSPEQAMDTKHADARSDIYSLGCSLYYLLTGKVVYDGDTIMKKLMAHQHGTIPSLVDDQRRLGLRPDPSGVAAGRDGVPTYDSLDSVFRRMVAKRPEDRPQSMTEVIAELERCLSGGTPTVVFERSGSSATNVAASGATGSGNELQDFLRQISGGEPATATSGKPSGTVVSPSSAEAETMISSANGAGTDPRTEQTLTVGRSGEPMGVSPRTVRGLTPSGSPSRRMKLLFGSIAAAVVVLLAVVFATRNKSDTLPREVADKQIDATNNETGRKRNGKNNAEGFGDRKGSSDSKLSSRDDSAESSNDSERAVAEWVISKGGDVTLVAPAVVIAKVADLPRQPFAVRAVNFRKLTDFSEADALRLTRLGELQHVAFFDSTLSSGSIRTLAGCRRLQHLFVDHGSTSDTTLSESLQIPQLRQIDFNGVAASDEFVARLGQLSQLQFVQIHGCKPITEDGLIRMAAAPPLKLQRLVFIQPKVSADGLRAIARLPHLQVLALSGSQLEDAPLVELARCPTLAEVRLTDTRVTQAGTTELQKALSGCEILVSKPEQAPPLYGPAYRDTIRQLMTRGFPIGVTTNSSGGMGWIRGDNPFPKGDVVFAEAVANIFQPSPGVIERADLQLLAQLSDLRSLGLGKLPPDGLRELLPLKNLTSLNTYSPLTDADIALLPSFSKLSNLSVVVPSDAALATIATLPHLSNLTIQNSSKITDNGLKVLESARVLSNLDLGHTDISLAAAQSLANARPDIIVIAKGQRLDPVAPKLNGQAPPPAKAPFDAEQARAHQEAWAKHLGTTVETINSVGAKMILIPPGEFRMGSTDEQVAGALKIAEEVKADQGVKNLVQNAERPQHQVVITKPFLMSATEVTIGQFKKFAAATAYQTEAEKEELKARTASATPTAPGAKKPIPTYLNPDFAVTDDSPAGVMTWNDAVAYCQWLSKQENATYRLPTEAEWEYACRAGTPTQYSFGDDLAELEKFGWYNKNCGGRSHPVGTKLPNAFGLFDMHGNLYEWCGDFWDAKWYEKTPLNDPNSQSASDQRVIRGGSWFRLAADCRSAFRNLAPPSIRDRSSGFRVVRVLDGTATTASVTPPTPPVVAPKPFTEQVGPQPAVAKAPFDAKQARAHQEAWAKHLGTMVETINSVGAKMILIPPGEFLMGSSDEQVAVAIKMADDIQAVPGTKDRIQNAERPQHRVVITKPFWMSSTEVTIGQFKKLSATGFKSEAEKAATDDKARTYLKPEHAVTDDFPAAWLTWNDAVAYCRWLSEQEKTTYRLPTEAEWEYVCRTGTTTQFSFGDDHAALEQYAWYIKNAGNKTHPVGTKVPNAFGLYDMHGSLGEWCQDFFEEKWYEKSSPLNPSGPVAGSDHVIRGGFWNDSASLCRSAYRHYSVPSFQGHQIGFRVVRVLDLQSLLKE